MPTSLPADLGVLAPAGAELDLLDGERFDTSQKSTENP